ncbi:PKD domain-containing protein [Pinibacter aurantiacus]|uniref:T9SS type A sorting domain-containing protein n=1 Tax=Pinibacter aurantiacus TaxID=2851599 RepID=A0A9E2W3Q9_9BACT|nr:PKD domain-containing protein [Pinibacter aurantiacus]MBV4357064.1 T9SS type A sorting domain-containing protein [Pinibacter aurantiacus]
MKRMLLLLALFSSYLSFGQLTQQHLTAANGTKIGFYQFLPAGYNPAKKYPMIVFLHGSGEVGNGTSDLPKVLNNGIGRLIKAGATMTFTVNGETSSFIVLMPQLASNYGNWQDFYTDEMMKYAKANLSIDLNRIYLTGLSLGGGGTWRWSSSDTTHTAMLAGMAPICGTGETQQYFCWVTYDRVACWAFHNMDDGTVPVGNTQYAQMTLDNCDPNHNEVRQFTYYPSGGHNAWDKAYDTGHGIQNPNLYEFFLMNPKKGANPEIPIADAGPNVILNFPQNSTNLDGSKSRDPNGGTIVSYRWRAVERSDRGTIQSPNSAKTVYNNLTPGLHVVILEVVNDKGQHGFDVVNVAVKGDPNTDQPPVAVIIPKDTTINAPSDSVHLDGEESYDPDNLLIYNFHWQKASGAAGDNIVTPDGYKTAVKGLKPGTYYYTLTVSDFAGKTDMDSVKIVVNPPPSNNKPPVANAGDDFSTSDKFAYLSAGASYDPDGKITTYLWSQASGPNTATILSGNTVFPTVQGLVGGTYKFRVVVTDNYGATDDDTVAVQVLGSNKAPIANAGPDQNLTLPASTAKLDGSGSSDPDGNITTYAWTKLSGPAGGDIASPGSAKTDVSNLVAGTYTYQLTVTDNMGATSTATTHVTVGVSSNKPPVANAGNDFSTNDNFVYLSAGASYDPDGSIAGFLWSQVSGPNTPTVLSGNTMFPTVQGLIAGTYVYRVVVTDNQGTTAQDDVSFTVNANKNPVAVIPGEVVITIPGGKFDLNATQSYDPDGTIVSYEWSASRNGVVNLSATNKSMVSLEGLVSGEINLKLTVTDNRGGTGTATVHVIVTTDKLPVAKAGFDFVTSNSWAYLSGAGSYDLDGHIVSFAWTQAQGPSTANILGANTMFPTVSSLVPGLYRFNLVVTDDAGFWSSDYVTVVVIPSNSETVVPNALIVGTLRNDLSANGSALLYPNPVRGTAKLLLNNTLTGKVQIVVFDATGKMQMTANYDKRTSDFQQQLDVSKLAQGVYYMQIMVDGKSASSVKKFIKL